MGRKMFVGKLAFDTANRDLHEQLAGVGTCEPATVVDRDTRRLRGSGFVEMTSASDHERSSAGRGGRGPRRGW